MLGLPIPDNYKPSYGELDNVVYITCKYTINWPMRMADLAVVLSIAGGPDNIVGDKGISNLVSITTDYLYDHVMGKPKSPTSEQLFNHIQPMLFDWYENTTPEERANTESANVPPDASV